MGIRLDQEVWVDGEVIVERGRVVINGGDLEVYDRTGKEILDVFDGFTSKRMNHFVLEGELEDGRSVILGSVAGCTTCSGAQGRRAMINQALARAGFDAEAEVEEAPAVVPESPSTEVLEPPADAELLIDIDVDAEDDEE